MSAAEADATAADATPTRLERLRQTFTQNPVFQREIGVLARRGRVGWVVFVSGVGITLLIASTGGSASEQSHPGVVGVSLFQAFFTLMHALALILGPAIAASSVASEREGRTLEALVLTGMSPGRIALGKTLAAVAHVGTYAVALAPVGALPFLFGGVPAAAVPLAFVQLAFSTTLAAMLGLAISSRMRTTRASLITSLAAGAALTAVLYLLVGDKIGASIGRAHGALNPGPMWLPMLLASGALPLASAAPVLAALALAWALTTWFFFAVCVAGLTEGAADRASGLKRWYATSALVGATAMAAAIVLSAPQLDPLINAVDALFVYAAFALFGAFVFVGDDVVPPRRVRLLWERSGAGALRRLFGPGVRASATLQLGCAAVGIAVLAGAALARAEYDGSTGDAGATALAAVSVCVGLWITATVGFATWLRARFGVTAGRTVMALATVVLTVAPYAASTILAGPQADEDSLVAWVSAPSPLFAFESAQQFLAGADRDDSPLRIAVYCACALGVLGLVALARGASLASRQVREVEEATRAAERSDAGAGAGAGASTPASAKRGLEVAPGAGDERAKNEASPEAARDEGAAHAQAGGSANGPGDAEHNAS